MANILKEMERADTFGKGREQFGTATTVIPNTSPEGHRKRAKEILAARAESAARMPDTFLTISPVRLQELKPSGLAGLVSRIRAALGKK